MSKQTALTKAIVELQSRIDENTTEDESMYLNGIVKQLTDLLPYEREVIEDAYEKGIYNVTCDAMGLDVDYANKSDYFEKAFK